MCGQDDVDDHDVDDGGSGGDERMVTVVMVMGHCWAGVAISGLITPLNSFHYQWTTQRSRKVNGFDGDDEKMDRTITMT